MRRYQHNNIIRPAVSVAVILAAILILFGLYVWSSSIVRDKPELATFSVENNQFVVTGNNLERVEIVGIPTGTGIPETDYARIGDMRKGINVSQNQQWILDVPPTPMLLTEIRALAYNKKGELVATRALPYVGATEIYNNVWPADMLASSTAHSVH